MEALYKDAYAGNDAEIPILRTDLSKLQTQILAQNEKPHCASTHIDSVRLKLQSLQNPYKNKIHLCTRRTHRIDNKHSRLRETLHCAFICFVLLLW